MKRLVFLLAALCAVPAAAQDRPGGDPPGGGGTGPGSLRGYANPSAVIAAELALARDAQARGGPPAREAAAASDAVLFAPRLVWAQPWLKRGADAAPPRRWEPVALWSSCDGSVVLSRGVWSDANGTGGWIARIWQRQGNGVYKWAAELVGPPGAALASPDMIAAQVADCPPRARPFGEDSGRQGKPPKASKPVKLKDLPPLDPLRHGSVAGDGTLRWEARVEPDGAERLVATWRKDGADRTIIDERVMSR